ncbi:hypothetical protein [Isoptericola aurantiacus]|uniref:hypothetical protein n=1 Tax=Isoptericola aurantiacus TaxID=3377839 RepID=UPI00383BCDBC
MDTERLVTVRPWPTALWICVVGLAVHLLLLVAVASAVTGGASGGWSLPDLVVHGLLWTGIPVALVGLPGAALLVSLVWRYPLGARLAAFAGAGVVFGLLLPGSGLAAGVGSLPGWGYDVVAAVGAAVPAVAGCAVVAARDRRRGPAPAASGPDGDSGAVPRGAVPRGAVPEESGRVRGDGAGWASPLVWLVAVCGIVLVPLWTGFGALITASGFMGSGGDPDAAASFLGVGAGVAVGAAVIVLVVTRLGRRRGASVRGGGLLVGLGVVVAAVLAAAAATVG